jgi:hypothetical protein
MEYSAVIHKVKGSAFGVCFPDFNNEKGSETFESCPMERERIFRDLSIAEKDHEVKKWSGILCRQEVTII